MPTFAHHLTASFSSGFYSGIGGLEEGEVPYRWPVAIGGHGYIVDDRDGAGIVERSVPLLKQSFLSSALDAEPSEASLNPEGMWRRGSSSWHKGAGQTYRDHSDSDKERFGASKGVDVWTRGQLTLLPGTSQAHASANTNLFMTMSQGNVYYADNQTVKRTDLTTPTNVTGSPAAAVTALTSIGATAFAAFGASGTYSITGTVATVYDATAMTKLGFAKGRLLGANTRTLYDLSTGAAVTVLTHLDTSFVWVAFAEGENNIYAAGNSSDVGLIYRTAVKATGTALDVPVVAGRLPTGETAVSIFGYAGLLFIGTSLGYRVASQSSTGDLTIGPLVRVGSVSAWTAQGQYVYFGWTNYDATSTGVGRIDPTIQVESLQFAYASDIMVTGQGTVQGLVWASNAVALSVSGLGIYKTAATLVASGTLDSGIITYRLSEDKVVVGGRVSYGGYGIAALTLSTDSGAYNTVTDSGMNSRGTTFQLRVTLTAGSTIAGPTVTSTLLLGYVAAASTMFIFVPVFIRDSILDNARVERTMNIADERAFLKALWLNRDITSFQDGEGTRQVIVEDLEFQTENPSERQPGSWNGVMTLKLKELI